MCPKVRNINQALLRESERKEAASKRRHTDSPMTSPNFIHIYNTHHRLDALCLDCIHTVCISSARSCRVQTMNHGTTMSSTEMLEYARTSVEAEAVLPDSC